MNEQRVREIADKFFDTIEENETFYYCMDEFCNLVRTAWREGMQEAAGICDELLQRPEWYTELPVSVNRRCAAAIRERAK